MMKVAHIAPINFNIPKGRSGPGRAAYNLQEGLVEAGIDATLFGCKNFSTSGKLKYFYNRELNSLPEYLKADTKQKLQIQLMNYAFAMKEGSSYDIVQSHMPEWTLPFALAYPNTPMVLKYSNRISKFMKDITVEFSHRNVHFVAISNVQKQNFPESIRRKMVVIHECVDTENITPKYNKKDFFLFVGRLVQRKQPNIALMACIKAKKKLVVIGSVPDASDKENYPYFLKYVKPYLSNQYVHYIQSVDSKKIFKFYGDAQGVIFPTDATEPFGLVFIESLACGTPIIGLNNAIAREVVGDKKVSLLGTSINDIARKLDQVKNLQPKDCREYAEQHYSRKVIVAQYLALYNKILRNLHV